MDDGNSLREWGIKIGLPALFYGLGLTMMFGGPSVFWYGVAVAVFASIWFAWDWYIISKSYGMLRRVSGNMLTSITILIVGWLVFRAAPLPIYIEANVNPYIQGELNHDIIWDDWYSEAIVRVKNDTNYPYSNIDLTISTDLEIAKAVTEYKYSSCVSKPDKDIEFRVEGEVKKKKVVLPMSPMTGQPSFAPAYRITCEKLIPKSEIRIEIAIVHLNPIIDRQWPKSLVSNKTLPKIVNVEGSYEAYNRNRWIKQVQCFDKDGCIRK